MSIKSKCHNKLNVPAIHLNGKQLEFVSSYTYFEVLICVRVNVAYLCSLLLVRCQCEWYLPLLTYPC